MAFWNKKGKHADPNQAPPASSKKFGLIALVAALLIVLGFGLAFGTGLLKVADRMTGQWEPAAEQEQTEGEQGAPAAEEASTTEETATVPTYEPVAYPVDPVDLSDISGEKEITTFALYDFDNTEPTLSEEQEEAIQDAIDSVRSGRNAGFVFIDLNTGKGIAYNSTKTVFGASSFKGPYSLYICQTAIDEGRTTTDSGTGSLISSAITYSDNSAYMSLRNQYNGAHFNEWLEDMDIDVSHFTKWIFPEYTAQESAKFWEAAYLYQQEGNETSKWLFDLYSNTNVSFIRDALEDEKVQVWNKAGWVANSKGASSRSNGVSDAGIIAEEGGHTYVMSILTDTPDSGSAQATVKDMASSLWDARDALYWSDDVMASAKATAIVQTFAQNLATLTKGE